MNEYIVAFMEEDKYYSITSKIYLFKVAPIKFSFKAIPVFSPDDYELEFYNVSEIVAFKNTDKKDSKLNIQIIHKRKNFPIVYHSKFNKKYHFFADDSKSAILKFEKILTETNINFSNYSYAYTNPNFEDILEEKNIPNICIIKTPKALYPPTIIELDDFLLKIHLETFDKFKNLYYLLSSVESKLNAIDSTIRSLKDVFIYENLLKKYFNHPGPLKFILQIGYDTPKNTVSLINEKFPEVINLNSIFFNKKRGIFFNNFSEDELFEIISDPHYKICCMNNMLSDFISVGRFLSKDFIFIEVANPKNKTNNLKEYLKNSLNQDLFKTYKEKL